MWIMGIGALVGALGGILVSLFLFFPIRFVSFSCLFSICVFFLLKGNRNEFIVLHAS